MGEVSGVRRQVSQDLIEQALMPAAYVHWTGSLPSASLVSVPGTSRILRGFTFNDPRLVVPVTGVYLWSITYISSGTVAFAASDYIRFRILDAVSSVVASYTARGLDNAGTPVNGGVAVSVPVHLSADDELTFDALSSGPTHTASLLSFGLDLLAEGTPS